MDNIKYKASLRQLIRTSAELKYKPKKQKIHGISKKCNECNKNRIHLDKNQPICYTCYTLSMIFKPSKNTIVDYFIKYTQITYSKTFRKIEFVWYDQFKDLEFIAERGFSKVYKATWINSLITYWNGKKQKYNQKANIQVALKSLYNSENLTSKELNKVI